ncbi:hypothetical protein COCSUDRAFT_33930 [Coccomyxa subellipsoidea C-169]|uniref:Uncharacterized protein n=1 Tax=Coccomyxa subellipsoidea (strain C-169) TaxID=574566 RepID=I0YR83_COCSC|nr:hypothetical protein COCSUDRAFT_33930 [Coccomyxa subellipsoidea C-169]EIE20902.1 hypothetical protein COCSUDRAFT_33930 [Coccomyxa subellipsoidea C-169]|eukprot:XP_005645446.1 hypothetical protein COCSUDRAFT_33930 [Coccomyxa subellipsoidea C-169]
MPNYNSLNTIHGNFEEQRPSSTEYRDSFRLELLWLPQVGKLPTQVLTTAFQVLPSVLKFRKSNGQVHSTVLPNAGFKRLKYSWIPPGPGTVSCAQVTHKIQ